MSRHASRATADRLAPARPGLFRRGRWTCPDCGLASRDAATARLGFCVRCNDFTGMCAAGRKIVCPDMMSVTTWHTPCTNLGAVAWQVTQDAITSIGVLCPEHDGQLRTGSAAWIRSAVPVAELHPA